MHLKIRTWSLELQTLDFILDANSSDSSYKNEKLSFTHNHVVPCRPTLPVKRLE